MVTMRSAPALRAASVAAMTAARGVCGGMAENVPAVRLPSAARTLAISSVSRSSVPLAIRKTRVAPALCAKAATASAAGLP